MKMLGFFLHFVSKNSGKKTRDSWSKQLTMEFHLQKKYLVTIHIDSKQSLLKQLVLIFEFNVEKSRAEVMENIMYFKAWLLKTLKFF